VERDDRVRHLPFRCEHVFPGPSGVVASNIVVFCKNGRQGWKTRGHPKEVCYRPLGNRPASYYLVPDMHDNQRRVDYRRVQALLHHTVNHPSKKKRRERNKETASRKPTQHATQLHRLHHQSQPPRLANAGWELERSLVRHVLTRDERA